MDPLDQLRQHYSGLWLREERASGQVYVGRDVTGAEATIAVLSDQSATDPGMRNAFADVVWRHSVGSEPGRASVYAADLHAARPWAATRGAAGQPGAEQLLTELGGMAPPPASPMAMPASPPVGPPPPAMPPGIAPAPPPPGPAGYGPPPPGSAGVPGAPGFGPPPGGYQPAPARSNTPWPLIGIVGGALVIMLIAVGTVVGIRVLGDNDDQTLPTPPPPPPQTGGPTEGPTPTEQPTESPGGGDEPELRDTELVSVIGPNFSPNEDTFTMTFAGWPFAFRTPATWGCLKGELDAIPEAEAWRCIDEGDPGNGQFANVVLWECPTTCTENEQAAMNEDWLDDPDDAEQAGDAPTYFVEYERNDNDNYGVDLSHFFGEAQEGEQRWMVGVYVQSPPDTRDDVLKILNDIVSQAG